MIQKALTHIVYGILVMRKIIPLAHEIVLAYRKVSDVVTANKQALECQACQAAEEARAKITAKERIKADKRVDKELKHFLAADNNRTDQDNR